MNSVIVPEGEIRYVLVSANRNGGPIYGIGHVLSRTNSSVRVQLRADNSILWVRKGECKSRRPVKVGTLLARSKEAKNQLIGKLFTSPINASGGATCRITGYDQHGILFLYNNGHNPEGTQRVNSANSIILF